MVQKESTIKTFWTVFFAVVAVVAIATAVFVGVYSSNKVAQMRMSVVSDENFYKISQENNYKQALYAACDSMKNLDANLGKAAISQNVSNQTQMLTDIIIHANHVNQHLSNLPISESENLEACQRFVNQAQDYATYLLKKIARGERITSAERTALSNLDGVATNLYNFLQDYAQSDSGMFLTNGSGLGGNGTLSDSLDEVEQNTFTYEKLIYDGPFSESISKKTLKANIVSPEKISQTVFELFGENQFVQKVHNDGEWYCFQLNNGRVLTACDGRVAQYECYSESSGAKPLSGKTCIGIAEEFCKKLGYDVKGVWVSKTQEQVTYVNCATVKEGVIIYPDLIKVAVDCFSGKVVGCEARAYLLNHQDWQVEFGNVTSQQAQSVLDSGLVVTNVAKALVEKNNKHYLCYEFQCECGDRQYYVYVDGTTGEEVEIFKVIQNTEGHTTM